MYELEIPDVRFLNKNFLTDVAVNKYGVLQRASFRPNGKNVEMFGWNIMWVPDFDSNAGFMQIIIPAQNATRDIKDAAKKGKRTVFLAEGYTEEEFDIIYRIPKLPEKFAMGVMKPFIHILRHPKKEVFFAALRDYDAFDAKKRSRWNDKHGKFFRSTGVLGKYLGALKQLAAAFDAEVKPVSNAPMNADDVAAAKLALQKKFNGELEPPVDNIPVYDGNQNADEESDIADNAAEPQTSNEETAVA